MYMYYICVSVGYSPIEYMLLNGKNVFLNTLTDLYPMPRKLPST